MSTMSIGRGWTVVTADGKRVGDVTEVHPHYLLVSRGVILVRDMYLPLGTVERTENTRVILSVTHDVLRRMDLSHEPAPLVEPEPAPLHDPGVTDYQAPTYESETASGEPITFPGTWEGEDSTTYEEMPSYTHPQPNGLIEVEHALNLAFQDLGYGSTILLLQGWPFDSTVWEPLPTLLAQEHRVISYDPRGTGGSDRPWDYYSVELLSHDLHRVIVEQALRDVTLVAWSSAAPVALLYAREHPDRVARVLLLNPLLLSWLAADTARAWLGEQPELSAETQAAWEAELLDDRPGLFERLVDRLTHAPLSGPQRHWLWQRLMLGAPHAQYKTWQELRIYDPSEMLSEVQVPVTILAGEHDRLSPPPLAAHLGSLLPRAQSVVLSDCGHASFLEQRAAVLKAITDLIATAQEQEPSESTDEQAVAQPEDPAPIESESAAGATLEAHSAPPDE